MVDGTDDVWAGDAGTDGTGSVPIDRTTPDTTQDAEPDAAQDTEAPGRGSRPTARLVAWSRDVDRAEASVAVSIVIAAVVALVGSFRFQTKPDAEDDHYQSGYEAALVDLRNAPIGEEQDLSTDEDRAPPAAGDFPPPPDRGVRLAPGAYRVLFEGSGIPDRHGAAVVTAIGDDAVTCRASDWDDHRGDEQVDVVCVGAGGEPVDAAFSVMFAYRLPGDPGHDEVFAYLRIDRPSPPAAPSIAAGPVPPAAASTSAAASDQQAEPMRLTDGWSSGEGTVEVVRLARGRHEVRLVAEGFGRMAGNLQVNALGEGDVFCAPTDVVAVDDGHDTATVTVGCIRDGALADVPFALTYAGSPAGGDERSFTHLAYLVNGVRLAGDDRNGTGSGRLDVPPIGARVRADAARSLNGAGAGAGADNWIVRTAIGRYEAIFPDVEGGAGHVQVTPVDEAGRGAPRCAVDGWTTNPPSPGTAGATAVPTGDVTVHFHCFDRFSSDVDTLAYVSYEATTF
ncbi:hypothetical protein FRAHR75_400058 [Frankia sp. Hr75.2]|nr:hypothetical protein FRAHR75_400058 [Frankia sp. Hr75.2]